MPAVLVELGFMSNGADLAALRKPENRDDLAERLFLAFRDYKSRYDEVVDEPGEKRDVVAETGSVVLYGTQVLASRKRLPDDSPLFQGYRPMVVKSGDLYKYIIGVSEDEAEAKKNFSRIRQKNPDCFLTKITK